MAVPVEGVRIILESILKTFANVEYEALEEKLNLNNENFYLIE